MVQESTHEKERAVSDTTSTHDPFTGEVAADASPIRTSPSIVNLAESAVKMQAALERAVKGKKNPQFTGSKYADMAATVEASSDALAENGLCVLQFPVTSGGRVEVTTRLLHESGEWMESTLTMTPEKGTPQALGSAITYARRYGWQSILGIAADDDDGSAASEPAPPPKDYSEDIAALNAEIADCETLAALQDIGKDLKRQPPEVKDAVRKNYSAVKRAMERLANPPEGMEKPDFEAKAREMAAKSAVKDEPANDPASDENPGESHD